MKLTRVFRNSIGAAVVAGALMLAPTTANAGVFVSVGIAPPAIPVYVQPPCPGYGYIWTPGYWAYGPDGYYWIDGAWVLPPYEGALWTPGYWGWGDDSYFWNPGYWGLSVGYYGGINYGFGYFGTGLRATLPPLSTTSKSMRLPACCSANFGTMSRTVFATVSRRTLSMRSLFLRRASTKR